MQVLVAAASKHGATAEIAKRIGDRLETAELDVAVEDLEHAIEVGGYDAYVIGSGVYAGRWIKNARKFVERNSALLASSEVWLFSSGPLGDPLQPHEEAAVDITSLIEATQPNEHRLFPGAIDKDKLSFGERAILKAVRAVDGDYRNWEDIEEWADTIAAALAL